MVYVRRRRERLQSDPQHEAGERSSRYRGAVGQIYLPVGLTFGPVNGPDDFNFVVDRAYAPGKGRRLRYTKEWIAYVDDLTVRTGRVVDGKFYTDSVADQAVREACAKGSSQMAPQSPESAMEALGFEPKPPQHDAARYQIRNL